jgi:hypothetical protein
MEADMTILANRILLTSFALAIAATVPVWAQSGSATDPVVTPAPVQDAHARSVRHTAKIDATEGPQRIAGPIQSVGPLPAGPVHSEGPTKSAGPVWTLGPYKSAGPNPGTSPFAAAGPLQTTSD